MLNIGLLLDSEWVAQSVMDLISWCQNQDQMQVTHAIIRPGSLRKGTSGKKKPDQEPAAIPPFNSRFFTRLIGLERFLLPSTEFKNAFRLCDIRQRVPNVVSLDEHDDPAAAGPGQEQFDVLLQFGTGRVTSSISQLARFGVLIVGDSHYSNLFETPMGFWEVFHRDPVTHFCVLKTTSDETINELIFEGSASTGLYFTLNRIVILKKAMAYLKHLLRRLAADEWTGPTIKVVINRSQQNDPNANHLLLYTLKNIGFFATLAWRHLVLRKRYRWEVAIAGQDWKELDPQHSIRIPNPDGHFLADPFIISEEGQHYCLVEDLDYRTGRGVISAYAYSGGSVTRLGEVLTEPFHLSFPSLFRVQNKIYMCPESSENRDIRIYEAVRFPLEWKLARVIMQDVSAVDSLIFEHDGRWWLLTNIDSANVGDHSSELHLFFTDHPLTGDWTPHRGNPIVFDAQRARNGGILMDQDQVYRVSQMNRFFQYGTGVAINRIDRMNETEYNESQVRVVDPGFFSPLAGYQQPAGNHHLHSNGQLTVFDFCRLRSAHQRDA